MQTDLSALVSINPLNTELNPICHLLALLGARPIFHVSRIRVNSRKLKCIWTVLLQGNCIKNYVYSDYHRQATKMFHTPTLLSVLLILFLLTRCRANVRPPDETCAWIIRNSSNCTVMFACLLFNTTLQDRTERLRLLYWACLLCRSSADRNIYCPHGNGATIQCILFSSSRSKCWTG
jgi:hypothetical protein